MGRPVTGLGEVGRRLAAAQDRGIDTRDDAAATARLLATFATERPRARRVRRLAAALAVVLAIGALLWLARPRAGALTFSTDTTRGEIGRWVAAPPGATLPLRFSDGSVLTLAPAARARVASAAADGANVVLERGTLACDIVHRAGARWRVHTGPFSIAVVGTRFEVSWEPETEAFRLRLDEGAVGVTGPGVEGERVVRAGEMLELRLPERTADVPSPDVSAEASAPDPPVPDPVPDAVGAVTAASGSAVGRPVAAPELAVSREPVSAPVAATASASASAVQPTSWRDLARAGRYRDALRAAEGDGFDTTCGAAAGDEVLRLGDTARLAGDARRARQAYLVVRNRFPGSSAAAVSALSLGRLAFDQEGAFASAAQWFEVYLSEQPGGPLAREAAGRLIEARERAGDRSAARAAARRYLAQWPDGPHAAKARSLFP